MAQLDVNTMKKSNTKGNKGKNNDSTAQVTPQAEPQEKTEGVMENPNIDSVVEQPKDGTESTEDNGGIDELLSDKPVITADESTELTDTALEKVEDTDETAEEPQEKTEGGKVVVTYIGGGTYRDNKHECWANEDKSSMIKKSRVYSAEEYEKRGDLKFMVRYGSMTAVVAE